MYLELKRGGSEGLVQLRSSFVLLAELFFMKHRHILSDWTCNRLDCVEHFGNFASSKYETYFIFESDLKR